MLAVRAWRRAPPDEPVAQHTPPAHASQAPGPDLSAEPEPTELVGTARPSCRPLAWVDAAAPATTFDGSVMRARAPAPDGSFVLTLDAPLCSADGAPVREIRLDGDRAVFARLAGGKPVRVFGAPRESSGAIVVTPTRLTPR